VQHNEAEIGPQIVFGNIHVNNVYVDKFFTTLFTMIATGTLAMDTGDMSSYGAMHSSYGVLRRFQGPRE
jgi:hypothetical protein